MPKTGELSMKRSAIRARERRDVEREEQRYNTTLKEFVQYKYEHIIKEFDSFYEDLKSKYPKRRIYVNTNEFRMWRKRQIEKAINSNGVKVAYFDSIDIYGKGSSDSEEFTDSEQIEQQEQQQHGEQQQERQQHGEQQQEQQQHGEQQQERQQHGEQQQEQQQHGEQQQERQQHGEQQQEQQQHGEQQQEQQQHGERIEQHGEQQQEQQQQQQQQQQQHGEQQELQYGDEGNIIAAAMEHADNKINEIILELENGGVPLHDDEGIHLDIYEELQGDIEDFDYRLDVELEGW